MRPVVAGHARQMQRLLAFLTFNLAHCSKIVFGVLEVILRHDPIPG